MNGNHENNNLPKPELSREAKVARALLSIKGAIQISVKEPFTLASGLRCPIYVDNRKAMADPGVMQSVINSLAELIEEENFEYDIIAGVEIGGVPFASILMLRLWKPVAIPRKKDKGHGTGKMVDGAAVENKRVLVIEDQVSTGGSVLEAVKQLRHEGATVEVCLAITTHRFDKVFDTFAAVGVNLYVLATFDVILDEAVETGKVKEEDVDEVRSWLRDPEGWSERWNAKNNMTVY